MIESGFGHSFHDINYFEVEFIIIIPCIHYLL